MKRLLLGILVGLVVLVVILAVAAQVVLWTQVPRNLVQAQLREQLGLDVRIDRLRAGLFGHTTARGVTVALPLAQQPFAEVPTLELEHTALPWLIFGWGFNVDSVTLERPVVHAEQDAEGRWNLQHAQAILAAHLRGPDTPDQPAKPLDLPTVTVRDATVVIDPARRDAVRLRGVEVRTARRGPLAYEVAVKAPDVGTLDGRLATVSPHIHEVRFDLSPAPALIEAFTGEAVDGWSAMGAWTGRMSGAALVGRLTFAEAQLADVGRLSGPLEVRVSTDGPLGVRVEPRGAALRTAALPEPVRLVGGGVVFQEQTLSLERLRGHGRAGGGRRPTWRAWPGGRPRRGRG